MDNLSRTTPANNATSHDTDDATSAAPVTVLYVEDHPVNVMLMQALFQRMPHVALNVATTGEDGLRMAIEQPPSLLLLDLNLPDCHGAELLARMREHPELAEVSAIAVSAEDASTYYRSASFAEFWQKPLDMLRTIGRLDALLGGAIYGPRFKTA